MDIIYSAGSATAAEVRDLLPDPPSYSAVRALLRVLEEKGHLKHEYDGPRYVYSPTVSRTEASKSALSNLVATFFGGSPSEAAAALLDMEAANLDDRELDELAKKIDEARREGR